MYINKCMYISFDPLGVSTVAISVPGVVGEETGESSRMLLCVG
jgi:hypothetical protein